MPYNPRYFKPFSGTTETIASGAIKSEHIADGAVKTPDIANDAVTSEKIASDAIKIRHLSEEVYNELQLQSVPDNSIGTEKIINNAITAPKIAPGAITTDKIQDSSITSGKIATSAVTKIKLSSNSVGYLEIINGSVTTPKIVDGAVTSEKIGDGEVTPPKLDAIDVPSDGEVPSYNAGTGRFEWVAAGGVSRPLDPPVATDEIEDNAVTKTKLAYKVVSITVPIGAIGKTEPPGGDPELVGGVILGYSIPTNEDQMIKQLVLLPTGGVLIELAQSAILDNTFDVVVLKP